MRRRVLSFLTILTTLTIFLFFFLPTRSYANSISGQNRFSSDRFIAANCGNNVVNLGEACDDGNTDDGDGCSSECRIEAPDPVCGNGRREGDEECDNGDTDDGDGCSSDCRIEGGLEVGPFCGNGLLQRGEECDDGNADDGDGCSSLCRLEDLTSSIIFDTMKTCSIAIPKAYAPAVLHPDDHQKQIITFSADRDGQTALAYIPTRKMTEDCQFDFNYCNMAGQPSKILTTAQLNGSESNDLVGVTTDNIFWHLNDLEDVIRSQGEGSCAIEPIFSDENLTRSFQQTLAFFQGIGGGQGGGSLSIEVICDVSNIYDVKVLTGNPDEPSRVITALECEPIDAILVNQGTHFDPGLVLAPGTKFIGIDIFDYNNASDEFDEHNYLHLMTVTSEWTTKSLKIDIPDEQETNLTVIVTTEEQVGGTTTTLFYDVSRVDGIWYPNKGGELSEPPLFILDKEYVEQACLADDREDCEQHQLWVYPGGDVVEIEESEHVLAGVQMAPSPDQDGVEELEEEEEEEEEEAVREREENVFLPLTTRGNTNSNADREPNANVGTSSSYTDELANIVAQTQQEEDVVNMNFSPVRSTGDGIVITAKKHRKRAKVVDEEGATVTFNTSEQGVLSDRFEPYQKWNALVRSGNAIKVLRATIENDGRQQVALLKDEHLTGKSMLNDVENDDIENLRYVSSYNWIFGGPRVFFFSDSALIANQSYFTSVPNRNETPEKKYMWEPTISGDMVTLRSEFTDPSGDALTCQIQTRLPQDANFRINVIHEECRDLEGGGKIASVQFTLEQTNAEVESVVGLGNITAKANKSVAVSEIDGNVAGESDDTNFKILLCAMDGEPATICTQFLMSVGLNGKITGRIIDEGGGEGGGDDIMPLDQPDDPVSIPDSWYFGGGSCSVVQNYGSLNIHNTKYFPIAVLILYIIGYTLIRFRSSRKESILKRQSTK